MKVFTLVWDVAPSQVAVLKNSDPGDIIKTYQSNYPPKTNMTMEIQPFEDNLPNSKPSFSGSMSMFGGVLF